MKKFGIIKNWKKEIIIANSSGDESSYERYSTFYDKVLYDFETGYVFFAKGEDIEVLPKGFFVGNNFIPGIPVTEKERIDLLSNILDEGIPYCYSILGIFEN